jgi:His Kinase A (phospho-acceptor) domain
MSRPEATDPAGGQTGPPTPTKMPTGAEPPVSGIEILSAVSHELRTPLVSIQGYTSLLLHRWENLADDDKRMMLEQVHHDAERVTRLIGELLDVGRLETGQLVVHRRLVDLPALAASVADRIRLQHPDLDVTAVWPDHFPRVGADPDKIEQVLTNLLENACKYASPKGVTITGVNPPSPPATCPRSSPSSSAERRGAPTASGSGCGSAAASSSPTAAGWWPNQFPERARRSGLRCLSSTWRTRNTRDPAPGQCGRQRGAAGAGAP